MKKHVSKPEKPGNSTPADRRIRLEREYEAEARELWDLWTTKDGIEAWWGPDGFKVTVRKLDLRPGGELLYAMTAVAAPQVEFMKKAGMPLSHESRITYTDIVPLRRLAYVHVADFIPGVTPYDVATVVEFESSSKGTRMILSIDPMHEQVWTERATAGWNSQLDRLGALISGRAVGSKR